MGSPDLIGRDFTGVAPGQRLGVTSPTSKTGEGWLYLATVIDLATQMVTGWQLATHMRTSLVTDALAMVISHGHVPPAGLPHPSPCQVPVADYIEVFCNRQRSTPLSAAAHQLRY